MRKTIDTDFYMEQLGFELSTLKEWKDGDGVPPKGWSIEKQKAFIVGMRHAKRILTSQESGVQS